MDGSMRTADGQIRERRTARMRSHPAKMRVTLGAQSRPCERLSLIELAERIVQSDRQALTELHDARPLFRKTGGSPALLAEFVAMLRETRWARDLAGEDEVALDLAYDLTIAKYAHLPVDDTGITQRKQSGPDCRNAFGSFLREMTETAGADQTQNPVQDEIRAAKVLQRRVVRSFQFSCLDARRGNNPARSRYAWHIDGSAIYVWMPAFIPRHRRRLWLEESVSDVDPSRPGEQRRVQAIVDERLGIASHLSIEAIGNDVAAHCPPEASPGGLVERDVSVHGLARVVAEEKASNITSQRPAVRALGKSRLKRLILRVFEELGEEAYEEKRLANAFGLSRATLSRFAGSRWKTRPAGEIPDLWANTAQTLTGHGRFVEAAEEAGVWDEVQRVVAGNRPTQSRRRSDA